jgi:hypothetical protein
MPGTQHNLSSQLAEISAQLDAATREASAVIQGLSPAQLHQRAAPDSWSVAECIVHLNMTSKEYLPILDEALERARQAGATDTRSLKMDVMGRMLRWMLEPPVRFKTKTTNQFQPQDVEPLEEVLPAFVSLQGELKTRVEKANGLAIDKAKIASPFNDRIKYNLFSAFQILVTHERRHIWQADQVRKAIAP